MKILVTYLSVSGNTKKLAEAIADSIHGKIHISAYQELSSLAGFDLVFFGFPMYGFDAPDEVKTFLKTHGEGKRFALFITHGSSEHNPELPDWIKKCQSVVPESQLAGTFHCQGELAQYIIDELLKSDNPQFRSYGEQGHKTKGLPDKARLDRAGQWAKEVVIKFNTTG